MRDKSIFCYDATGNQTKIGYPDGTSVTKSYDLVGNLERVVETDGRTTTYEYDGMRRVVHMEYPDGWQEDYTYDAIGQLLAIDDTDPTEKDMKQQKNRFEYDACGNMTYEYMRGNGTGEATVEVFYTYDELHQVTHAQENYGNKSRSYQYDSLGNLTWETNSNNVTVDYKLNNLNQITTSSDDGWKTSTTYTYDQRGNLVETVYGKNKKQTVTGAYTYDETNKMVKGVNELGESSAYLYNGLGALVTNTWTIKKNAYGYHDVSALTDASMVEGELVVDAKSGKKEKKDKKDPEVVAADANLNKTSTVVKDFVIDYTVETLDPLYETESTDDGLDYRYVYGLNGIRLSVTVKGVPNGAGHIIENGDEIRLYYHQDLRGTVDYLTSPVSGKVESWTHYNEWGEITHNAVLKCGQRELDMVKNYTGHEYDQVLGMYYAKARFYAPELRRFLSMDPVKGSVMDPISIVQYLYVKNGPLVFIDPLGEYYIVGTIRNGKLESYRLIDEELGDSLVMAVNAAIGNEYTDTLIYTVQRTAGIIGGTSAMDLSAATVFSDAKSFWELLSGQKVNWEKLVERVTNQAIGAAQVNRKIRQLQAIKASKLGTVFGVIYASYNFLKSISESIDRAKFDAPFLDFAEELGIVSGQNVTLDELKKRIDVLTKFIEDENKSYYFRDCFFDLYCWNSTPGAEHRGAGVQDIETSSMWLLGYMASQGRTVYEHFLDNSEPNPELFWKFEGGDRKNFNIFLISTAGYELYMEYGRKFYTDDPRYQAKMIELRNEFNQLTDIDYVLEQRENMLNKLKNLLK